MNEINLNDPHILSSSEACFLWGIDDSWLRKKISDFPKGTIRRVGKQWIVTSEGMQTVFGEPNPKQKITKEKILKLYKILQGLLHEQTGLSMVERIKFCTSYLELQDYDKTFATSLAEAVCERYDLNLLIDIYVIKEKRKELDNLTK